MADLTESALKDREVLALAQRVVAVPDKALDWNLEIPPGRVEIVTHDGRVFKKIGSNMPGSAEAPMNWEDLGRKFDDCMSAAAVWPAPAQVQQAKQMVRELENLEDATDVLRLLQ